MTSNTCLCSTTSSAIIEACQSGIVISISVLAMIFNMLTMLVLRRVRKRSSTETLLLAITASELALPLIVVSRYVYVSLDDSIEDFPFFRVVLFYTWNVFYVVSILLTLLLAARRYIAIKYPLAYQSLSSKKHTNRMLLAIYVFSILLYLPALFYRPDFVSNVGNAPRLCSIDMSRKDIYTSIMMATVYLKGNYTVSINYLLYISIFFFQLLSPLILAVLSFKFKGSLDKRVSSSPQAHKKTRLIFIVSLLILMRDLPLGLLSTYFICFLPAPACLTTVRLLSQELMIVMSAMNFFVLYATNQKFKEAIPHLISLLSARGQTVEVEVFSKTYRSRNVPSSTEE